MAFDSIIAPIARPGSSSPDDLIGAQQPLAAEIVRALGITLWPAGRFQADDLLATGAVQLDLDDDIDRVVICTTDNDLNQCVRGDRVVLLDRIRDIVTDEAAVPARYGVDPDQIPDLFALVGDRSDGLAGLPGWGQKSAAAVLNRHGRVEAIPDDDADWDVPVRGSARLAAVLRERREEAVLGRDLSIRRGDLPITVTADGVAWRGASRDRVAAIVEHLSNDSMVDRIPKWTA